MHMIYKSFFKTITYVVPFLGLSGNCIHIFAMDHLAGERANPNVRVVPNEEASLEESQILWARNYEAVVGAQTSANTQSNLAGEFQRLSLISRPKPEVFHLYVRNNQQEAFQLVKNHGTPTVKLVKIYGPTAQGGVNYTTLSSPPLTKESLTHPRTHGNYQPKRSTPTKKSTSYPEGCKTYHYTSPSGDELRFDLGHGTAHADTCEHPGLESTKDPENFVPQNQVYNSPVRRDLEDDFRRKGLTYKEISIYHRNCQYPVTARVKSKNQAYNIPIPEGFVLLALNNDSAIQDAYYFPNFVNYGTLMGLQSGTQMSYFSKLYRITNLQEWFWNPGVTLGDVEGHLSQLDLASNLTNKLLLSAPTLFRHLTEQEMPPKARVALLATLLEWNVQSAASLEFVGLSQQLNLVYFYTTPRVVFELDERFQGEKMNSLQAFLRDITVTDEAHRIVDYFSQRCEFIALQQGLQQLAHMIEETKKCDPNYWENAQKFLNHPELYKFFSAHAQDQNIITLGNDMFPFSLARLDPVKDLDKFHALIGGFDIRDLQKAGSVLKIVERRALASGTSILEKLHFLRLFQDDDKLPDPVKKDLWEKLLLEHAQDEQNTTLLEKRRIADFYGIRGMKAQKGKALSQLFSHLESEPTRDNFKFIAYWCLQKTGVFLQTTEEAHETDPMRASTYVALQIYRGLASDDSNQLISVIELESRLGVNDIPSYTLFTQGQVGIDFLLGPLVSLDNPTGPILRKISDLFQSNLK
jgi:hypothetical protein